MRACARVHIWSPDPERGAHALDLFSNTDFSWKQVTPAVFPSPVFIYSMPGYSCNIKERMLYSSCKSRLLEEVERDYHLEIAKKVKEG